MVSPSLLGDEEKFTMYCPNIVLTPVLSSGWWMTCKKVALVVSSISKRCVCLCLNSLLPSEGLSAGEDVWGTLPEEGHGTKPFREEDGVGTYKYTEGVGKCRDSKPSRNITTSNLPASIHVCRVM